MPRSKRQEYKTDFSLIVLLPEIWLKDLLFPCKTLCCRRFHAFFSWN